MNHPNRSRAQQGMSHDRMTAWACVNAILRYCGQEEALFGEWRDITDGREIIDPVEMARRLMARRPLALKRAEVALADYHANRIEALNEQLQKQCADALRLLSA